MSATQTPAARDDTRSRSSQGEGQPVNDRRGTLFPRAAGAAQTRGAQPSGRRVVICQLCRKRVYRVRNGEWYHAHNSSVFCRPGCGNGQKAVPLEITDKPKAD